MIHSKNHPTEISSESAWHKPSLGCLPPWFLASGNFGPLFICFGWLDGHQRMRFLRALHLRVAYVHLCLNQIAAIIYLEQEDGAEKGSEAKSDQTHLSQVQLDTKAKVERGRNQVFGELWT